MDDQWVENLQNNIIVILKQTFVGFGPGCDEVKLNRIAISYGIYFFGKMELIKNRVLKQFFVGFNFFISPKRICPQI